MKRLIIGILLLLVAPASANLLGSPQVRRELRVTPLVAAQIVRDLNEAARLSQGGVMSVKRSRLLRAERRRVAPEALQRRALNRLSPAQKRRLDQIGLQRGGSFVFEDWNFARRVGMSPQQHQSFQRLAERAFARYVREVQSLARASDGWRGRLDRKRYAFKYASYDRAFERIGKRRQTAVEAGVSSILTLAQKARWRALTGAAFRARLTCDLKVYALD